ncbi:MAG: VOC family protein [Atribacterota bacterium]
MARKILLNHVGIQCSDRKKTEVFFTQILEIPKLKSFTISEDLSESIFGITKKVVLDVYDNGKVKFEVFINDGNSNPNFEHTCIEVENKKEFIRRCMKYGINLLIIKKEGKDLLFVSDFSHNLYEVKEKS